MQWWSIVQNSLNSTEVSKAHFYLHFQQKLKFLKKQFLSSSHHFLDIARRHPILSLALFSSSLNFFVPVLSMAITNIILKSVLKF